jgi:hypothetical protein
VALIAAECWVGYVIAGLEDAGGGCGREKGRGGGVCVYAWRIRRMNEIVILQLWCLV